MPLSKQTGGPPRNTAPIHISKGGASNEKFCTCPWKDLASKQFHNRSVFLHKYQANGVPGISRHAKSKKSQSNFLFATTTLRALPLQSKGSTKVWKEHRGAQKLPGYILVYECITALGRKNPCAHNIQFIPVTAVGFPDIHRGMRFRGKFYAIAQGLFVAMVLRKQGLVSAFQFLFSHFHCLFPGGGGWELK